MGAQNLGSVSPTEPIMPLKNPWSFATSGVKCLFSCKNRIHLTPPARADNNHSADVIFARGDSEIHVHVFEITPTLPKCQLNIGLSEIPRSEFIADFRLGLGTVKRPSRRGISWSWILLLRPAAGGEAVLSSLQKTRKAWKTLILSRVTAVPNRPCKWNAAMANGLSATMARITTEIGFTPDCLEMGSPNAVFPDPASTKRLTQNRQDAKTDSTLLNLCITGRNVISERCSYASSLLPSVSQQIFCK